MLASSLCFLCLFDLIGIAQGSRFQDADRVRRHRPPLNRPLTTMNTTTCPFAAPCYALSTITLRCLQLSDTDLIGTTLATMDPWRTLGYADTALKQYLDSTDPALRRFAIHDSASGTIGVVCVRFPWLRGPYLELLGVFPAAQGRGVGQAVLAWLESEARRATRNIWTVTSEFNARARQFYRAAHFVEVALLPDLVTNGYSEILLRKTLSPQ
jgi:GNAT superfamily N-acetyltransferase